MRGLVRALTLLLVLLGAACQSSSSGMGMDFDSSGPGWNKFSGGKVFGAPL